MTKENYMRDIRKWLSLFLVVVLALGVVGLAGCTTEDEGDDEGTTDTEEGTDEGLSGTINVEGSDTLVNMAQVWAEEFMTEHSDVMISVKGGGSGTGIASMINGTVDFANASRQIKDEEIEQAQENGIDPVEHEVALDGIAVVVNPDNTVTGLTMEELGQIFRGEITNWNELGGDDAEIVVLSRDSSSGTYEFFKETVVDPDEDGSEYAAEALLLPSNSAIVDETSGNASAIGYIGVGYVNDSVKVLEIDGVAASVETAADGSYPISRYLYTYSDGEPEGLLAEYLDWIMGPDGQQIVEDEGFVPLP
jgi:phosphate transport system substrate-binding protein